MRMRGELDVAVRGASRSSAAKRAFDLVVGLALLLWSLPVILVLAVVLGVSLRAWPFFVQERIGFNGRPLRFLKLRTLTPSTPRYMLKTHLSDASMPWFSRVVRNRHLDELPQILLVLAGRMSLVGPRPKMPDAVEPVSATYAAARTAVPQGCTGLWQISAERDRLPHEVPAYDYFYIEHASLKLDLWILVRTALVVLRLADPVRIADVPAWVCKGSSPAEIPSVQHAASMGGG